MAKKTLGDTTYLFQSLFSANHPAAARARQRERDLRQEEEDAAFERELDHVCGKRQDVEARITKLIPPWRGDEDNQEVRILIIKEEL